MNIKSNHCFLITFSKTDYFNIPGIICDLGIENVRNIIGNILGSGISVDVFLWHVYMFMHMHFYMCMMYICICVYLHIFMYKNVIELKNDLKCLFHVVIALCVLMLLWCYLKFFKLPVWPSSREMISLCHSSCHHRQQSLYHTPQPYPWCLMEPEVSSPNTSWKISVRIWAGERCNMTRPKDDTLSLNIVCHHIWHHIDIKKMWNTELWEKRNYLKWYETVKGLRVLWTMF